MNPLTSLASRLSRQLFNQSLDDVRAAKSVAPEGFNAVRQTPVPKVLGRARFDDGFEKNSGRVAQGPLWSQPTSKPTTVAVDRFRDSFQLAARAPVNLSGESASRSTVSPPTFNAVASNAANAFTASLDDLPHFA